MQPQPSCIFEIWFCYRYEVHICMYLPFLIFLSVSVCLKQDFWGRLPLPSALFLCFFCFLFCMIFAWDFSKSRQGCYHTVLPKDVSITWMTLLIERERERERDLCLFVCLTVQAFKIKIKSNHFYCHITNCTCAVVSEKLGSVLQTFQNTIDTFNK